LITEQAIRPDDVSLAGKLVFGVVRHRLTLVSILDSIASGGWKRIHRRLRPILLVGLYQLIWLDGVPEFAAVHQTVEQAKATGGPRAGRFVNALLRDLLRKIEHRRRPVGQVDMTRAVLVSPRIACQFVEPLLPDPEAQPIEHLATLTSHPAWLASHWTRHYGAERARNICLAGMFRPPIWLRPNPLRTSAAELHERLTAEGIGSRLADEADAVVVPVGTAVAATDAFDHGLFQPQDHTAMMIVRRMNPRPGGRVLDLCAGLGTKSTQLAEQMRDKGEVLAADQDDDKLDALMSNCRRLCLTSVRRLHRDSLDADIRAAGPLDWILIDAPCSNSGVFARRPEARYRITSQSIADLATIQLGLLEQALGFAAPTTKVAYSTCSIEPAENEEVVREFGRRHSDWRLIDSQLTLPHCDLEPLNAQDGGFWAIWVRKPSA
jgi:16S rRNA (cytosine967-C5)-methyltransferase